MPMSLMQTHFLPLAALLFCLSFQKTAVHASCPFKGRTWSSPAECAAVTASYPECSCAGGGGGGSGGAGAHAAAVANALNNAFSLDDDYVDPTDADPWYYDRPEWNRFVNERCTLTDFDDPMTVGSVCYNMCYSGGVDCCFHGNMTEDCASWDEEALQKHCYTYEGCEKLIDAGIDISRSPDDGLGNRFLVDRYRYLMYQCGYSSGGPQIAYPVSFNKDQCLSTCDLGKRCCTEEDLHWTQPNRNSTSDSEQAPDDDCQDELHPKDCPMITLCDGFIEAFNQPTVSPAPTQLTLKDAIDIECSDGGDFQTCLEICHDYRQPSGCCIPNGLINKYWKACDENPGLLDTPPLATAEYCAAFENCPTETELCQGECLNSDDCEAAALSMGLSLGSAHGRDWNEQIAQDHGVDNGCFYYPSTNEAYFVGGGSCAQVRMAPSDDIVRIRCDDGEEGDSRGLRH